jgi:hypothetical protein
MLLGEPTFRNIKEEGCTEETAAQKELEEGNVEEVYGLPGRKAVLIQES